MTGGGKAVTVVRTICCGQEIADASQPPECGCRPRSCAACGRGFLGDWRRHVHRALGCEADPRAGIKWPVTSLVNPVTRTTVKISPPFAGDDDALASLVRRFDAFCRAAWDLGRLDPPEVAAPPGWTWA